MVKNVLNKTSEAISSWLRYHFLEKKMGTPVGIAVLGFIAIYLSYLTVLVSAAISSAIVVGVAGLLLFALCILYPYIGFYTTYAITILLMLPSRLSNAFASVPAGLIPEYLGYLALLGVITRQEYKKEITGKFWSSTLTTWMIVLFVYWILEIANPAMNSKFGWFQFFRKQVSFGAFFYMSYCFFNSRKAIKFFVNFWVVLSSIEAIYVCKQQWLGFFSFEYNWLVADPERYDLFVNGGFVRRFGLMSDPAAAGIFSACSTAFILGLALRATKTRQQVLFFTLTAIHFMASSYTGTRTATLMVVAAAAFYCVLTLYEKRTIIISGIFIFAFVGLLVAPIHNNMVLNRIRSTFQGGKDPSNMVRDMNRKMTQPYVYSHPIGGGIFTAGLVGSIYNPGHYLSNIPPDSAYMVTMMEQGPIGLALLLIFYFVILRTGIRYFYRVKDPELKTFYIANLMAIFAMFAAQYSQQAIGQYPSVLYFYSALALFLKMHLYDEPQKAATNQHDEP
jgi:putative inorganic carbon (HCO3(-)) transporter